MTSPLIQSPPSWVVSITPLIPRLACNDFPIALASVQESLIEYLSLSTKSAIAHFAFSRSAMMGEGSSDFITTDDDDDHEGDGPFAPRKAARPDLVRSRGEDGGRRKDEGKERKKGRASGLQPSVTTADSSQTKKAQLEITNQANKSFYSRHSVPRSFATGGLHRWLLTVKTISTKCRCPSLSQSKPS